MKAITVEPMKAGSACLEDIPEPDNHNGSVLVEAVAVGVCGTDIEIAEGLYGWAPPGKTRLVLGHESLGRVLDPGPASGLKKGDLVVGEEGTMLWLVAMNPEVLAVVQHSPLWERLGRERMFFTLEQAVERYQQQM